MNQWHTSFNGVKSVNQSAIGTLKDLTKSQVIQFDEIHLHSLKITLEHEFPTAKNERIISTLRLAAWKYTQMDQSLSGESAQVFF